MSKKATGIVAYIAPIGWLIAFLAGDKEGAKFHLNQALVLWICEIVVGVLANIPVMAVAVVASLISLFLFVCWILGLINACKEQEKELPLIGKITILK